MKWLMKLTVLTMLASTLLGSASVAFAQDGPAPGTGRGGPIRGQVTEVTDTSLTIATRNDQTVTVKVTNETKVHILGSDSQGSLSDIQVDNFVGVRGRRNDDGSIQARIIVVLPEDPRNMARVRGKVTDIEGEVIVVENRRGSRRIITNGDTKFRLGKKEASLADIEAGHLVLARGTKQDDDSFVAKLVVAVTREQLRRHTLRGKVLSVDTGAGALTVAAQGDKEGTWTIRTTAKTKYHVPDVDNPTLADIPVDAFVAVLGRPAEDDSNTAIARLIAVIPEGGQRGGRLGGEVTAIDGTTFTLQSRHRGDFTVLTDDTTQYRTRGDDEVSFADIEVGIKVIVIGKPVEGQDNTIQAKLVGIPPADQTVP